MSDSRNTPVTEEELLDILQREDLSAKKLASIIQHFPGFVRDLIAHANAADLGLRRSIQTAEHAIAMLGQQRMTEFLATRIRHDAPHSKPMPAAFSRRQPEEVE